MTRTSAAKIWLGDPAAWPIFGVIGAACLLCAGASTRYLTRSPDVQWNKSNRQMPIRDNVEESLRWTSHKTGIAYMTKNVVNQNAAMVKASRTLSRRNTKADYEQKVGLAAEF